MDTQNKKYLVDGNEYLYVYNPNNDRVTVKNETEDRYIYVGSLKSVSSFGDIGDLIRDTEKKLKTA